MRFIALFPLLCVVGSFVLSLLAILAGMNPSFMENFEIITFNTSLLGTTLVNKTESAQGGIPTAVPTAVPTSALSNIPASVTSQIPPALATQIAGLNETQIAEQIAQDLNIHDFYKIHILNYCEGFYEPGPIINSTNPSPSQNLTFCAPATPFSFFNATQVLQQELKPGITLDQIQWPSEIQDAIDAMEVVQKVMFVLYCVGCGFSGVALLEAIIAFLFDGRLSAVCNAVLDIFAFIALAIASGCATGLMYVVVNAVNQFGSQVNVSAYKGTNFLAITWVATVLPLIASVLWCVDCCIGPDRKRRSNKW